LITLSMISLVVGAALGQRFKVLVLLPAIAIVLILPVASGVTHTQTAWSIVLMVATAATSMQIGYFVRIGIGTNAASSRRRNSQKHFASPAEDGAKFM
jgi:hypothetical protein